MLAVRHDYRDIVEVYRHRYTPDHPSIVALRERPRDVRLTIDANQKPWVKYESAVTAAQREVNALRNSVDAVIAMEITART